MLVSIQPRTARMITKYTKILNSLQRIYLSSGSPSHSIESISQLQAYARSVGSDDAVNQKTSEYEQNLRNATFEETAEPSTSAHSVDVEHINHVEKTDEVVPPLEQLDKGTIYQPMDTANIPDSQSSQLIHTPRYTKVPSSRIGRLFHYGGLAAGLTYGTATEYLKGSNRQGQSLFLSEGNVDRLVNKLSTMRGAALKLGQFLSIQDSHLLPPQIETALSRLQNRADYMPNWQLEAVLSKEYGPNWMDNFEEFNKVPIAAASIGQVHSAILSANHPKHPLMKVALKIQFPGVKESINSDLNNLKILVSASGILPRGLYLDSTIKVMRAELADECDYLREAECGEQFALNLENDLEFKCPVVVKDLCTSNILTTEFMSGEPLSRAYEYDQSTKDKVSKLFLIE